MKSLLLQPTEETILDTFENDYIGRNSDVIRFVRLLNAIEDNCSIAVDAPWGAGKTFFVKQVQLALNVANPLSVMDDESKIIIKIIYKKNRVDIEQCPPQVSVYYDAWLHDSADDPILSIVSEIMSQLGLDESFNEPADILDIAEGIIDCLTSCNLKKISDALKNREKPLSKIKKEARLDGLIRQFIDNCIVEKGNRLVVFIDELDRCSPSYAVKVLERVKHYFNHKNVTFVFSVNLDELCKTIEHFYGIGFSADKYLDRFFDLKILLPPANMDDYYNYLNMGNRNKIFDTLQVEISEFFSFTLREVERFHRMCKIAVNDSSNNTRKMTLWGKTDSFCELVIVPVLIGLSVASPSKLYDTISGNNKSIISDVLLNIKNGKHLCGQYLLTDEERKNGNTDIILEERINDFCNKLFSKNNNEQDEIQIGNISVDWGLRERVLRLISLLSTNEIA